MARMSGPRLYLRYVRIQALSSIEFKGWWFLLFQMVFSTLTEPAATLLLFSRFGSIGVWSAERILLTYGTAVASYGLADVFFGGFAKFPWRMMQQGDFDRVLLRPRSTVLQVGASSFELPRIARAVSGLTVAGLSLWRMGVPIGPSQALFILYVLTGGAFLYVGVFMFTSGTAFFSVKGLDWIHIFGIEGTRAARCPTPYMPRPLYAVFTFLMPLLPIAYYPASLLCGWGEPAWTGFLALPAGLLFFLAANLLWRIGIRQYAGTGS